MKIELTPAEFRRLIHLVYISTWILDAHKTEEDPDTVPYRQLEQKLFAIAARRGLSDLVTYDEERGRYLPTDGLEGSEVHLFIDEYDDDTFWDELIARLAQRDVINEAGGLDAYIDLAPEQRVTLLSRREEHYADEFTEHGMDRLVIAGSEDSS